MRISFWRHELAKLAPKSFHNDKDFADIWKDKEITSERDHAAP